MQTTQRGSLVVLRWSVGVTTSSYSMDNWENSTHLYSWFTSVYAMLQPDDPLLRNCCNELKQ